jgi:hypothetical protein
MPKNEAPAEVDFTVYATKTPTPMQARFADWLLEETEYSPGTAKTKEEAFRMGVALGAYLRPTYQASDANKSGREEALAEKPAKVEKAPKATKVKAEKPAKAAPAAPPARAKGVKAAGPRKAAAKSAAADTSDSPF